jgi:hypothetical protein
MLRKLWVDMSLYIEKSSSGGNTLEARPCGEDDSGWSSHEVADQIKSWFLSMVSVYKESAQTQNLFSIRVSTEINFVGILIGIPIEISFDFRRN